MSWVKLVYILVYFQNEPLSISEKHELRHWMNALNEINPAGLRQQVLLRHPGVQDIIPRQLNKATSQSLLLGYFHSNGSSWYYSHVVSKIHDKPCSLSSFCELWSRSNSSSDNSQAVSFNFQFTLMSNNKTFPFYSPHLCPTFVYETKSKHWDWSLMKTYW